MNIIILCSENNTLIFVCIIGVKCWSIFLQHEISEKKAPIMQHLIARELSPARQRLAVLSLALGSFASVTTEFLPVGILPDISRTFFVTPGTAGLTMTVPGMMAALSAPGVMLFSGRTDRRRIILWLSLILLAGCLIATLAPTFAVMLLSRALVGISLGAF
ncbi:MFS transporter [Novacetimonas sp. GS1]